MSLEYGDYQSIQNTIDLSKFYNDRLIEAELKKYENNFYAEPINNNSTLDADLNEPVLLSRPDDLICEFGTSQIWLSWTVSDKHPKILL
ncbi:MAG: hypothetical protein ACFFBD_21855 [Candidatus Hodarchaeota archaeon]